MRGEALVALIVLYIMTDGCLSTHAPETTNCFCTYQHRNLLNSRWEVVPFAGGRKLDHGEAVPIGTTVKFLCKEHLWHHMDGPTELVCIGCNLWSSSEFPTCRDPHNPFDPAYERSSQSVAAHIVWNDNPFLRLQANGSLVFTPGKNYRLHCDSSVRPISWSVPEKADVTVFHDVTIQLGSSWKVHSKILEIREANANHSGLYTCEDGDGRSRQIELIEVGRDISTEKPLFPKSKVFAETTSPVETRCAVPIAPDHGSVDVVGEEAMVDSIISFTCEEGRIIWGLRTIKCLSTGEWTFPPPQCVEPCKVPSISNGQIGVNERNQYHRVVYFKRLTVGDIVDDDQQLVFKCKTNFLPLGIRTTEIKVSCRHGQWSHGLQCQPVSCTTNPPVVPNARVGSVGTHHGAAVVYLCNRFYTKSRYGNITCESGVWQGVPPACRDTRCDVRALLNYPGLVPEEKRKRHYLSGETYAPACGKGFSVNGQLTCNDGRWKGHFPPCKAAPAPDPTDCSCTYNNSRWGVTPFAAGRKLNAGETVPVGATITFLCTEHLWHRMDGPTELVCSGCDRWSSSEFTTCQDPHDGEVHIVWNDGPFLRLQANGSLVFTPGKDYSLHCGSSVRPISWSVPEKADVTVFHEMQIQIGSDVLRVKFLNIREANANHSGVYRCEDGNGRSRQIELLKGDPGCGRVHKPAGSTLTIEPDKEFYVLGQSYTFRCPPWHRASSDAQRIFCLRSGWSEDTVPDCIPVWQD